MMLKAFCGLAAGCALLAFTSVGPAEAKVRQSPVAADTQTHQSDELSSQRRYRGGGYRGHRGFYGPRYGYRGGYRSFAPRYAYRPYYGGYYPAYGYRPYYSPGPSISFGFPGVGIGFGGPGWY